MPGRPNRVYKCAKMFLEDSVKDTARLSAIATQLDVTLNSVAPPEDASSVAAAILEEMKRLSKDPFSLLEADAVTSQDGRHFLIGRSGVDPAKVEEVADGGVKGLVREYWTQGDVGILSLWSDKHKENTLTKQKEAAEKTKLRNLEFEEEPLLKVHAKHFLNHYLDQQQRIKVLRALCPESATALTEPQELINACIAEAWGPYWLLEKVEKPQLVRYYKEYCSGPGNVSAVGEWRYFIVRKWQEAARAEEASQVDQSDAALQPELRAARAKITSLEDSLAVAQAALAEVQKQYQEVLRRNVAREKLAQAQKPHQQEAESSAATARQQADAQQGNPKQYIELEAQLAAARSEKFAAQKVAEELRQRVESLQAHPKERAILQAVVDQADELFEDDFGRILVGGEKEAHRKLFHRLAHLPIGYKVEYESPVVTSKCDLVITDADGNSKVVVEIKNADKLTADHAGQLMGYMRKLNTSHGLLLNFPKPNNGPTPQAMYHKCCTRQIVEQLLPSPQPSKQR